MKLNSQVPSTKPKRLKEEVKGIICIGKEDGAKVRGGIGHSSHLNIGSVYTELNNLPSNGLRVSYT
jgi:hypothetical protein